MSQDEFDAGHHQGLIGYKPLQLRQAAVWPASSRGMGNRASAPTEDAKTSTFGGTPNLAGTGA